MPGNAIPFRLAARPRAQWETLADSYRQQVRDKRVGCILVQRAVKLAPVSRSHSVSELNIGTDHERGTQWEPAV